MEPIEATNQLLDTLRAMSREQAAIADLAGCLPRNPDAQRLDRELLLLGRQIARVQRAALDLRDTLEAQDLD